MTNTLEKTLAFSGADIQVVAYRGFQTPAEKFEVNQTKRKIAEAEESLAKVRKAYNEELAKELSAASASQASQESLQSAQKNIDRLKNAGLENIGAGRLAEVEGKSQNKRGELKLASERAEIQRFALLSLEESIASLNKKIDSFTDANIFNLGSIHTLSYSSFREKFAVRTLGRIQAKAYTRGPRTIAGTMVFTVMQEHELFKLVGSGEKGRDASHPEAVMLDQIQPFNLLLSFANEYGGYSVLHLFDIDLQSEGQEMSIDQIVTHNTMNFYAREMLPMTNVGNLFNSYEDMTTGLAKEIVSSSSEESKSATDVEKSRFDAKVKSPFAKDSSATSKLLAASRGLF